MSLWKRRGTTARARGHEGLLQSSVLSVTGLSCTGPPKIKPTKIPGRKEGPTYAEEPLATDDCWGKEGVFLGNGAPGGLPAWST